MGWPPRCELLLLLLALPVLPLPLLHLLVGMMLATPSWGRTQMRTGSVAPRRYHKAEDAPMV